MSSPPQKKSKTGTNMDAQDPLNFSKSRKYPSNHITSPMLTKVEPVSGTNLKSDKVLEFKVDAGPYSAWQFCLLPILVKYKIKVGGVFATSTALAPANAEGVQGTALHTNAFFINPLLGASTFFESAEVRIHNTVVTGSGNLGPSSQYLYQGLNRLFARTKDLEKICGDAHLLINTEEERDFADPSDKFMEVLQATDFLDSANGQSITSFASLDGFPFIGLDSFSLSRVHGKCLPQERQVFPPNTKLVIKLNRTYPDWSRFEFNGSASNYFSADPAAKNPTTYGIEVILEEVSLMGYTITIPSNWTYPSKMLYTFDRVKFMEYGVASSQYKTTDSINVDKGTGVVMVAFVMSHQTTLIPNQYKALNPRFSFPETLKSVSIKVPGEKPLLFNMNEKLSDLDTADRSPTVRAYYSYLKNKAKVLDIPFSKMFPRAKEGVKKYSFRQAIFIDLSNEECASRDFDLLVTCNWSEPTMGSGRIVSFCVKQESLLLYPGKESAEIVQ